MITSLYLLKIFTCFYVLISEVYLEEYHCSDEKCRGYDAKENKYSEAANTKGSTIFKNVEEELSKYEPCVQTNCSCHLPVIIRDLQPFQETGITKQMFESVRKKGTKYQIISGRLYRQSECLFPARCAGVEHFLLGMVSRLPDTELILNTRDWPQLNRVWGSPLAPVFSFSKTEDYWDIMYPAWSFWEGGPAIKLYPSGLGKWHQHRISLTKAAEKYPWEKKKPMAFFRGSRTNDERDPIVLLSRSRPDIADAKYTKNQAWKSDADTLYAPPAEEVSLDDHCQYRYLFNYRGVAASFRFKHLFLCKSLVFHIGQEWLEFFYPSMKAWVHYIPVSAEANQEDIRDMIEFFEQHQSLGKEIALRGYQHIWDHLRIADVKCYWRKLIKSYTKLLKYKVERDNDLIEIEKK